MAWVFAALAAAGFVELLLRSPFLRALQDYRGVLVKATATMGSDRISDHWKELVLRRYALSLLYRTLLIGTSLALAALPFLIFWTIAQLHTVGFQELAISWPGILGMTAIAIAYHVLRRSVVRT